MEKQIAMINDQINLNNYVTVKSTIQTILKKYGKDEYLQNKIKDYHFILGLIEDYEKESFLRNSSDKYI